MRFVKKVSERGVVTLPTEVREALGIEEGDILELQVLGIARKAGADPTPLPRSLQSSDRTPDRPSLS